MVNITSFLRRVKTYIASHKKQTIIGGGIFVVILLYSMIFFIPKAVAFDYGGATCARQLTLLPGLHKATDDQSAYTVTFADTWRVGSFDLASVTTCFTPVLAPEPGEAIVATAPFGGWFAKKHFNIEVGEAPLAAIADVDGAIPVSRPLAISLSTADTLYTYRLMVGDDAATCEPAEGALACDVPSLSLAQGKEYTFSLIRQFKDDPATTLIEQEMTTLKAVAITKQSVKNNQTVYTKPTSFTFTTDKTVSGATVLLEQLGDEESVIDTAVKATDKTVVVSIDTQLARETKYRLTIQSLEATDGSTLVEPKTVTFTMSGGPKVTGVNIGSSGVNGSAIAVIQFDQALSSKVDVKKYVALEGGSAIISKGTSTVSVALQGLPRCKSFGLVVKGGLASKYDIVNKEGWRFSSRTRCHSVTTYGYSVQGRALNAYIFGNSGPVTMYVGAIHGNESSSSGLMHAWINHLEANAGRIGNRRIVVIPTINPDGLAMGTRNNARGVNLSRNFPTDNWERDIDDTDGFKKNGGGTKPLSEPESKALAGITQQYRPRLLLSFHAVGSLVVGDPGGYSAGYASKYASMVGYHNATGQSGTFDYSITGSYEDWTIQKAGIPSIVIELGSYGAYYFDHHRVALWAML